MSVLDAQNRMGVLEIHNVDARELVNYLQEVTFNSDLVEAANKLDELTQKYPEVVKEINKNDRSFFPAIKRIIHRPNIEYKIV